jgi:hypothetical protein
MNVFEPDFYPLTLPNAYHLLIAGNSGQEVDFFINRTIVSLQPKDSNTESCTTILLDTREMPLPTIQDKLNSIIDCLELRYKRQRTDPSFTVIVNDFADLMPDLATFKLMVKIAEKGRRVGILLIAATSSIKDDVITGQVKALFPTRVALHTSNKKQSRLIIDSTGAELLAEHGECLLFHIDSVSYCLYDDPDAVGSIRKDDYE